MTRFVSLASLLGVVFFALSIEDVLSCGTFFNMAVFVPLCHAHQLLKQLLLSELFAIEKPRQEDIQHLDIGLAALLKFAINGTGCAHVFTERVRLSRQATITHPFVLVDRHRVLLDLPDLVEIICSDVCDALVVPLTSKNCLVRGTH